MGWMDKEEIIRLLKIVSESTLDEVHLESGDLKFIARRHARTAPVGAQEPAPRPSAGPPSLEKTFAATAAPPTPAPSPGSSQKEAEVVPKGFRAIRSPMLGTFYRAPKPDAPPFVEVGEWVTEEDLVCIVEVMKLFNTVKAGVRGRIARICVENAQMVEYKQVLFLIEEETGEEREQAA
jgi:acetyl-CoA carboxylase biotin carboxyl carrier protein